ncbi:RseA family anti-sigma factor [Luteimonas sp. A537]
MSTLMTNDYDNIDFEPAPPDKLYAHNRRQLSAMLDGELSPDQARFMLRRLQHDGELAACWERWQVSGDVLRGRGHALLPADFSKRVAAAIAGPAAAAAAPAGNARPRPQRLLRWGGGALAASVALVALFMARQMPDAQAPELATASSTSLSAPVLVESAAAAAPLAQTAETDGVGIDPASPASATDAPSDLLAAAAPLAIAVAEVPRRAGDRSSTRSQAQRAAVRRSQAAVDAPARAVATAPRLPVAPLLPALEVSVPQAARPAAIDAGLPILAAVPSPAADGEALFGAPPAAATRPWPRATLSGLSATRPFAAGYGLQQADSFAPFQPRLETPREAGVQLPDHQAEADPR